MQLFGIDPDEDRLRIRALRAMPPMRAAHDHERRRVFSAALGQFDELITAAESVGAASRPVPQNTSDQRPGSFDVLAEAIRAPLLNRETMQMNVWAAIPGLDQNPGLGAGCPRALSLEFDTNSENPISAWLRHLQGWPGGEQSKPRLVTHIKETYPPAGDGLRVAEIWDDGGSASKAQLVGESELGGSHRTVYTAATQYLFPTSLWLIPKLSSGDSLPPILWWCLLQALSSLARYHPAEWASAINPDHSQWAVSIERALIVGLAVVPRLQARSLRDRLEVRPAGSRNGSAGE